jgi:hypothetical protein
MRISAIGLLVGALSLFAPGVAAAGPSGGSSGGSAKASISTDKGGKGSSKASRYDWPELVVGGNAIQFLAPLQIGAVGYLPKARFAFQYDRQLHKGHWLHIGAALVADHAGFRNFRMPTCGLENASGMQTGSCNKGGVVGFDIYAGYTHKFYVRKRPHLVPYVRGSLGYSFFALPSIGGGDSDRHQSRVRTSAISVRPGGGLRVFLLDQLGIGFDVAIPIGVLVHTDIPNSGSKDRQGRFLLGFELHPIAVEYRF